MKKSEAELLDEQKAQLEARSILQLINITPTQISPTAYAELEKFITKSIIQRTKHIKD